MISKLAQLVEMSLDVPDSDKKIARKIVQRLQQVCKKLELFEKQLDILYNPLKNNENVSTDSIVENRGTIRRYRDEIEKIFTEMRTLAYLTLQEMNHFNIDGHILDLIKTFTNSFNDIDESCNMLLENLDDYKSDNYKENVISTVENVQKQCGQLESLIKERIIKHINTNVIAGNWYDGLSETVQSPNVTQNEPIITRLFKEREEQLKQILK